jgi:uncharacterized protein YcbX
VARVGAGIKLSELTIYPVKSAAGVALSPARVEARGLAGDRRWMVVDEERSFLSQRTHPRLALVKVETGARGLRLHAPGVAPLEIRVPGENVMPVHVRVWRDVCAALPAGDDAARWISRVLGCSAELVYMPESSHRTVEAKSITSAEIGFADAYPFLLTSEASLADLNRRLANPIPMNRFRPNLVVRGCAPYAEDGWRRLLIGGLAFEVVKPCARCATTTVDQETGERGAEPLATLAGYRRAGNGVVFGQNLVHHGTAWLRVGDDVVVLE